MIRMGLLILGLNLTIAADAIACANHGKGQHPGGQQQKSASASSFTPGFFQSVGVEAKLSPAGRAFKETAPWDKRRDPGQEPSGWKNLDN